MWHQYTMRFPGERQQVIDGLTERGIGSLIYYPVPIHEQDYLQAFMPGAKDLDLPVTNRLSGEVLSIPVHPKLTEDELDRIVAAIREVATPADLVAASAAASVDAVGTERFGTGNP